MLKEGKTLELFPKRKYPFKCEIHKGISSQTKPEKKKYLITRPMTKEMLKEFSSKRKIMPDRSTKVQDRMNSNVSKYVGKSKIDSTRY